MKKSIIIILAVVAILVIWAVSVYNGLVTMDENVTGKWANVETQYQRRADLIPNLVNTVKGYATHEKETLEGVVAARSEATQFCTAVKQEIQKNLRRRSGRYCLRKTVIILEQKERRLSLPTYYTLDSGQI